MRIALDPVMYHPTHSVHELPDKAASLGYEWLELSPKPDFIPFFRQPRIDDAGVRRLRKRLSDAGVGIAAILPLQRWAGPEEVLRQNAVRAWRRSIQIAVELGVSELHSELSGRPEAPELSEALFYRSMEELLPLLEREGLTLVLEPHPDDYVEHGITAVDTIRGLNSPAVKFQLCLPHAFHMDAPLTEVIAHAGADLVSVHTADAFDHRADQGHRYIVNPPESAARVHQHMEVGRGDVDFDSAFAALARTGFDGVVSASVFGWDSDADGVATRMRTAIEELLGRHRDQPVRYDSPTG